MAPHGVGPVKGDSHVVCSLLAAALGVVAAVWAVYGAKLVQKFNPNMLKTMFGLLFLYVLTEIHHLFRYA